MAEEQKYKVGNHELTMLCMQLWQSGMGKMKFESTEAAYKYFSMVVEHIAEQGGWEQAK